jgi:hypothetical protein
MEQLIDCKIKILFCPQFCLMVTWLALTHACAGSELHERTLQKMDPENKIPMQTLSECSKIKQNASYFSDSAKKGPNYIRLVILEQFSPDSTLKSWYWIREWVKLCWKIFDDDQITTLPNFTDKNYTALLNYLAGSEDGYNIDLEIFNEQLKEIVASTRIYEDFLAIQRRSVNYIMKKTENIVCNSRLKCECISPDCTMILNEVYSRLLETISRLKSTYLFRRYVEPIVTLVIFCLGVLWDGTLLFIFFRHREVRTTYNAMLMNIAVSDMLGLVIVLPIQYALYNYHNEEDICLLKLFILMVSQTVLIFVSAFSILVLSAQRYFAVAKSLQDFASQPYVQSRFHVAVYIIIVWGAAVGITLGLGFLLTSASDDRTKLQTIVIGIAMVFLLAAVVLPLSVTVLNTRTATKLKQSAKQIPGIGRKSALVRSRYRSSRVIAGLSVAFWFTHSPLFVWMFLMISHGQSFPRYVPSVIYHLFFSNAFLNPVSLYITSRTFRKLFKRYIFRCWYNEPK